MREAIAAGADMINDINGFRTNTALSVVKESDCALCIMHMQKDPLTMQMQPKYESVTDEVISFLRERINAAELEGIARERLCIDPGFGFGKALEHNLALLKDTRRIADELGLPVLAGLSRKSMIGVITGRPVEQRLAGTLAANLAAIAHGAKILRVHDVAATVDAVKVWRAIHDFN